MRAAFFAVLLITAAAPARAVGDRASLLRAGEDWNRLYAAGDWKALEAHYEPDAWLMTDKAPLARGAPAIIAFLRRYRDLGAQVMFRFQPEDSTIEGRTGTVVTRYWMTAQMPGRPLVRTAGRALLVYKWRDGRWRLWRDMDNVTPDVAVDR